MIFDPSKNSILQNNWSNETLNDLINACIIFRPQYLILDCCDEYETKMGFRHLSFRSLITLAKRNNIKVFLMLGSKGLEPLPGDIQELVDYCTVQYFPTNFIATTTKTILDTIPEKLVDVNRPTQFTQMYYCFVNRPHRWRCSFVDLLHKHNADKIGKYTWNKLTKDFLGDQYKFSHWEEKIITGNDGYCEPSNFHRPEELYHDSFMEIVLESAVHIIFITEKTLKPLAWGKPFLVYAGPGFHGYLKELGFKLYTEIFDYSFDNIENDVKRAEAIITQINTLHNTRSYNDMYTQLKSKIEYNQKHLVKLHKDVAFNRLNHISKWITDIAKYTVQMKNSLI